MNAITKFKTQINIKRLLKERDKASKQIEELIAKLDNYGGECHCERDKGEADIVHRGEFDETFTYCLACGGTII